MWSEIKYWLFWRPLYPRIQRLMHRLNLHHMKVSYMPDGKLLWCHWCGARSFEKTPTDPSYIARCHAEQKAASLPSIVRAAALKRTE